MTNKYLSSSDADCAHNLQLNSKVLVENRIFRFQNHSIVLLDSQICSTGRDVFNKRSDRGSNPCVFEVVQWRRSELCWLIKLDLKGWMSFLQKVTSCLAPVHCTLPQHIRGPCPPILLLSTPYTSHTHTHTRKDLLHSSLAPCCVAFRAPCAIWDRGLREAGRREKSEFLNKSHFSFVENVTALLVPLFLCFNSNFMVSLCVFKLHNKPVVEYITC